MPHPTPERQLPATVYALCVALTLVGFGSLAVFGRFLWGAEFRVIRVELELPSVLAWDAVLCLIFFAQHSGMVRRSFRDWLGRLLPSYYYNACYTIASAAALVLICVCWQPSGANLLVARGVGKVALRVLFVASMGIFVWAAAALKSFDLFGVDAIVKHARREEATPMPLTIRGPYRWVRHPFYFAAIAAIWTCPILSIDRLLFNAMFTAWIVFGARMEERDLLAQFGSEYRSYQHAVPMLIPRRWPRPELNTAGPR